jgi:predicted phage terminase large subunit-like protein
MTDPTVEDFSVEELTEELVRRECVEHFSTFFRTYPPRPDYKYGEHTVALIERLDEAVRDFEAGISTNLIVTIPYRHGKSDVVSRRFPCWLLGRNPTVEVILACYGDKLAYDLSRNARDCMRNTSWMFDLSVARDSAAVGHWEVVRNEDRDEDDPGFVSPLARGNRGNMSACGIGGSIVGRGAHALIVDDYLRNRAEAESQLIRDRQWDSFNDDLRTRLAPVHICIVCATRWHEDDLVGRILNRQDPEHKDYDPEAPVFEEMRFPMKAPDGHWLFRQRFPNKWYTEQWSNLGTYGQNSLAQQNPQPRKGKLLRADLVTILPGEEFDRKTRGANWSRGWDIASSEKQVNKPDPDYSVGTKATILDGCVFVADVVCGQWRGSKRDKVIETVAIIDGEDCVVNVESVGHGGADTVERVTNLLADKATVRPYTPNVDKVARATPYESLFEIGNVYLREADWNREWKKEFNAFPNGKHDDRVDSLVVALNEQIKMLDLVIGF